MAVTQGCDRWTVTVEITNPTVTTYLARTIIAAGYLIETLETLANSVTYSYTAGTTTTPIVYTTTEKVPSAGTLVAVSTLFTTFGFTVV